MDISSARTFLEVIKTGSFVGAAENLNLTQTAVSARIRVLEEQLDRPLFTRNKAGARLTAAGEQFQRYATTLVQVWERARHQVALPAGREKVVTIGGEHSLWNPMLRDWLVWMRRDCVDVAVRTRIDVADRLMEQVQDGLIDLAVLYAPPRAPGIVAELLVEEKLVAATTHPGGDESLCDNYVYVDWGSDFAASHHAAFPDAASPVVSTNYGPLAMDYILESGGTGYFRMAALRPHLEAGQLHLVKSKPHFSYSIYGVYSAKADEELMERVRSGLRFVASNFDARSDD
ncbi:LysR family transcriptional regulator [Sphingosinicella rhizophila]|uniref:LysR family transcriptional regulator n=1 Tax=Sphingosinicella rhizophila TaxID=3050082 RepID=A0ABU3QCL6_9SPHN|nr:LysR family transcriptional regulator [Sphingosinicella sp. GR2756]MDT9601037.1 LysR family transcriptional regulator [Sphingosinicella sp. GR2756]